MPGLSLNYTPQGWPYMDPDNYVEVIPQYTDELAAKLNADVTTPTARLDGIDDRLDDPNTGLAALDGRLDTLEGIRDIVGAGRPDIPATMTSGVAALVDAAPSGTKFRSTNRPQGAWEWMKQGTTWVCVEGDTGWNRLGSPSLKNGWAGSVDIRRINNQAVLQVSGLTAASATSGTALTLTAEVAIGYRIGAAHRPLFHTTAAPVVIRRGYFDAGQNLVIYNWTAGDVLHGDVSYPCTDRWPATLPGVAV